MTATLSLPGIRIESELVNPQRANFTPPTWPPQNDFPVVIDADGQIISRYGDSVWKLDPWAGKAMRINFGDGKTKGNRVSQPNADLMRCITGWWLWGPGAVRKPTTLIARLEVLKPLFVACTNAGILASDLNRFPKVIEEVAASIGMKGNEALSLLDYLWVDRGDLGFSILEVEGLKQFSGLIKDRNSTQTAYVPPRIWTYQVLRLKECLDDFLKHRQQIEACYRFCLDAYKTNAGGSLAALSKTRIRSNRTPFKAEGRLE